MPGTCSLSSVGSQAVLNVCSVNSGAVFFGCMECWRLRSFGDSISSAGSRQRCRLGSVGSVGIGEAVKQLLTSAEIESCPMAYIVMAHIVMVHIVMAHIVMAHIVMAHIVMALYSYGP